MNFIILFIILQTFNVILSTIRSITTIKCNKYVASFISAIYYGYYIPVTIFTVADFSMWAKILITFVTNLIGVFIVKVMEEKIRKDKLWLVKMTTDKEQFEYAKELLDHMNISYSYVDIKKYVVFDTYCETQKQTQIVKKIAEMTKSKTFASENKL